MGFASDESSTGVEVTSIMVSAIKSTTVSSISANGASSVGSYGSSPPH